MKNRRTALAVLAGISFCALYLSGSGNHFALPKLVLGLSMSTGITWSMLIYPERIPTQLRLILVTSLLGLNMIVALSQPLGTLAFTLASSSLFYWATISFAKLEREENSGKISPPDEK